MFEYAIVIIFVLGYAAIAFEHKIGINKTATAILTAVICWVLLALHETQMPMGSTHGVAADLGQSLQATSQIVFFLIGAMTIVRLMESHGGFAVIAALIRPKNTMTLFWIISLITFFLSAVLDNLTTAIVMVSLMHQLIDDKDDRLMFASMIIIAANAGGAWTPIGDVTTTMLWIGGRVSTGRIMSTLFIPSLISMMIPLIYFSVGLKNGGIPVRALSTEPPTLGTKRIFFLGLAALISVPIFKGLTGLAPFVGILFGLGILWLVTDLLHKEEREHLKVSKILSKIDLTSILFFLGILLAIAALESAGILREFSIWMDRVLGCKDLIATLIGLASAIIDNVPLTAATMGMYPLAQHPMDAKLWELLAYSVGTGGSILIIGSAAGVVVMGMEKINFLWYLRRVSLPALLGYFSGIAAYLLLYKPGG